MSATEVLQHPDMRIVLQGKGAIYRGVGRAAVELFFLREDGRLPQVLMMASAATSQKSFDNYINAGIDAFGTQFGANVNVLHGFGEMPTETQVDHQMGEADIIWIPGGNTQQAKRTFEETGVNEKLRKSALEKVLGGGSAGTLILSRDSMSFSTPNNGPSKFIQETGLGFADITVSPHLTYVEPEVITSHLNVGNLEGKANRKRREPYFVDFLLRHPELVRPYIGIDDASAIAFTGDQFRVIEGDTKPDKRATRKNPGVTVFRPTANGFKPVRFMPTKNYRHVSELLNI